MKTKYHIIRSYTELKKLIDCCISTGYASVDWETNGLPLYVENFKPTILSVTWRPGYGASIPCEHFQAKNYVNSDWDWKYAINEFGRKIIENPNIVKVAWNWKFDNQIFYKYNIYYQGTVIDGMLAKYLLDEERPNGLKDMVRRFIPEFANYEKYDNFDSIPWDKKELEPLCKYGCMDTDSTLRLSLFFESKLIKLGFYPLYRNLMMAASRVLQSAEQYGMPFDVELNKQLKNKYDNLINEYESKLRGNHKFLRYERFLLEDRKTKYIEKLRLEIEELSKEDNKNRSIENRESKISRVLAGEYQTNEEKKLLEPFNFKSVKQLIDLLFLNKKGFRLPILEYTVDNKTKKPTNNPSTSENVLLQLKDRDKSGFIDTLLNLRGIQTINSTFIYGLSDLVQDDGCVHPRFLLIGTTSGRLSSREPNGQNIPKTMVNPDVKLQFITPPGELFLTYDYSQAELRILAHLANEKTMLEWFRTGKDIHLASACKKYGEDYDKIKPIYDDEQHPDYKLWKKRRKNAKCINFGICFSGDTEILTESGWQRFDSLEKGIKVAQYNQCNGRINFVVPQKYIEHKGQELWLHETKFANICATKNHRLLYKSKKLVYDYSEVFIEDINHRTGYSPSAGFYSNKFIDDNITRFIAVLIAKSNTVKRYTRFNTYTGQEWIIQLKTEFEKLRLTKILDSCNITYSIFNESEKGYTLISISVDTDLLSIINNYVNLQISTLKPEAITKLNGEVLLDELSNWSSFKVTSDITSKDSIYYYTTSKQNADIIQILGILSNMRVTVNKKNWKLYILHWKSYKFNQAYVKWEFQRLPGLHTVYCVTVPDSNIIVRRKGRVLIVKNCYEQTAPKLAETLSTPEEKVSVEEGQEFLDDFFRTFPNIKKYIDKQHKFMEEHGYVKSLFGRKRRCPKVYSEKYGEYLEALRQCVDEKTEVLTDNGWRRYNQVTEGNLILTKNPNNGVLEWQSVEKMNIYPDFEGDLYSIEGRTFSALTSGNHRWLCNHNTKPHSKCEFLTSEELYNSKIVRPIHRTGEYNGNINKVLDDDLVYLLGLILTDGHIRYYKDKSKPRYGKPWYVVITQSKKKNIPIIQNLVDKVATKFDYSYSHKIYSGNKNVWKFSKKFADYIDTIIPDKKLTMRLLMSLTKAQIKLLLDGMVLGDGCKHGTRVLTSNIEQANLIQVLIVMAGYYSNIIIKNSIGVHISNKIKSGRVITKNISYLVTIGKNKYFHQRSTRGSNHIKKLTNQKKLIWCPTVKNGTWVCRREGKTYITGNSTNAPVQSAASDMALFASVIVYSEVKKGILPPMREVDTVHDSVYQFIKPKYITPDTIYKIWDICRNPDTKNYFNFSIDDVDMSMDFTIGRTMAEELPFIPGYDYEKMLKPDFNIDEYYQEYNKVKHIPISEYPDKFKKDFDTPWRQR